MLHYTALVQLGQTQEDMCSPSERHSYVELLRINVEVQYFKIINGKL